MRKFISLDVFEEWSAEWLADTLLVSSTHEMMRHPRFHDLVALDHVAARSAVLKLRDGDIQIQWFLLLSRITGDNPVPEEQRGMLREMAARWVEYGEKRYCGVKRFSPEERAAALAGFSEMVRRCNEAYPDGLPTGLLAGSYESYAEMMRQQKARDVAAFVRSEMRKRFRAPVV